MLSQVQPVSSRTEAGTWLTHPSAHAAPMDRRLLTTLTFPPSVLPVDLDALADRLTDAYPATIVGRTDLIELRFDDPPNLLACLTPTRVDFYEDLAPPTTDLPEEPDSPEDPEDPLSPEDGAEDIILAIEILLRLHDDEDAAADAEYAASRAIDDADRHAAALVDLLLERRLLELVTPRSRIGVEGLLAHLLAHDAAPHELAERLADHAGVAELYAGDDELRALARAARRRAR